MDIVLEPGSALKPEDAVAQLRVAAKMVVGSNELRSALYPAILLPQAGGDGKAVPAAAAAPLIRNFVYVVIDHRRIGMIDEISDAFDLPLDERLGVRSRRSHFGRALESAAQRGDRIGAVVA